MCLLFRYGIPEEENKFLKILYIHIYIYRTNQPELPWNICGIFCRMFAKRLWNVAPSRLAFFLFPLTRLHHPRVRELSPGYQRRSSDADVARDSRRLLQLLSALASRSDFTNVTAVLSVREHSGYCSFNLLFPPPRSGQPRSAAPLQLVYVTQK